VSLQQYFSKQLIADPNENPLYRATQSVEEELEADRTFTNASSLRSLPSDYPFIKLTCIKSGDKLGSTHKAGCGSLVDENPSGQQRQLRPRPPQSTRPVQQKKGVKRIRTDTLDSSKNSDVIDLTTAAAAGLVPQATLLPLTDYRLTYPLETEDTVAVRREAVLQHTLPLQIVSKDNERVQFHRPDFKRIMGDMLNDNCVNEYLTLMCSSNLQYNTEHLPANFAPYIYEEVPIPVDDPNLSREDLHHRLRNFDVFTCDVLISPIITGGHITAVIADRR